MGSGRDMATTGVPTGQTLHAVPEVAEVPAIVTEVVRYSIKEGTLAADRVAGAGFAVLEAERAPSQDSGEELGDRITDLERIPPQPRVPESLEARPEESYMRSWWRVFFECED